VRSTLVESGAGTRTHSRALRASSYRARLHTAQPFWSAVRPRTAFDQLNHARPFPISDAPAAPALTVRDPPESPAERGLARGAP